MHGERIHARRSSWSGGQNHAVSSHRKLSGRGHQIRRSFHQRSRASAIHLADEHGHRRAGRLAKRQTHRLIDRQPGGSLECAGADRLPRERAVQHLSRQPAAAENHQGRSGCETFKVTLNTLEEGKRFAVNFAGKEGLPLGVYHQTIKLTTDSKETPELTFDLDLRVVPPVNVNPGKLAFENVPVSMADYDISGLSKFTWVTVTRSGGLEITNMTSDLPFIKVKVESVDNNKQTYLLRVGFSAKPAVGKHSGVIKIETNNKEIPLIEVPITVNAQ